MKALLIELNCPYHGFERFQIKVKRKFNMKKNAIKLNFKNKPHKDIKCILVGRNVTNREIERFIFEFFEKNGLYSQIINWKFI